jgi:hypothetical protein
MSRNRDGELRPGTEDRRLVDWIDRNYDPGPMGPSERAAFDRALEARLERRRGPLLLGLVGAAATCTVAIALWLFTPLPDQSEETAPPLAAAVEEVTRPGEDRYPALYALLYSGLYGDTSELDETGRLPTESLPEDYRLLASAFEL